MKKRKRKGKLPQNCKTGLFHIPGDSSLYGIIGFPLHHTASPVMHNTLFQRYRMHAVYVPLALEKKNLTSFFKAARLLIKGLNVTVPYKKDVIPFLDEIDEHTSFMHSANTVENEKGLLKGFNTDFIGLKRAIRENFRLTLKRKDVCILGAGGAASSALYLAVIEGARNIYIINRTEEKAASLARHFKSAERDIHIAGRNTSEALDFVKQSEIIMNTTSLGLHQRDPLPLKKSWLRKNHFIMDLIYNPRETRFLKAAKERGCRIANGLDMLVYQGAESFRIWTGKKPDPAIMKKAVMKVIY